MAARQSLARASLPVAASEMRYPYTRVRCGSFRANLEHGNDGRLDSAARRRDTRELAAVRSLAYEFNDRRIARRLDPLDIELHVVGEGSAVHLDDCDAGIRSALDFGVRSAVGIFGVEKLPVARHIVAVDGIDHL